MALAAQPLWLALAIIAATFVLEDVATVSVALLASQMAINGAIALSAVVAGTIFGDLAVYLVANRAASIPAVARYLEGAALKRSRVWLGRNAITMIVIARFTPGLRLPVFAGAGSLGVPLGIFSTVIILSTLLWTPGLFWAASTLGTVGIERLGTFGWLLAAGLVIALMIGPRLLSARSASRFNDPATQ